MPVHPHHCAKALEPEWIGEPCQKFVAPIFLADRFGDHRAELAHPSGEPLRHLSMVQRQVGAARPLRHGDLLVFHHSTREQTRNNQNPENSRLTCSACRFITKSFYNTSVIQKPTPEQLDATFLALADPTRRAILA